MNNLKNTKVVTYMDEKQMYWTEQTLNVSLICFYFYVKKILHNRKQNINEWKLEMYKHCPIGTITQIELNKCFSNILPF